MYKACNGREASCRDVMSDEFKNTPVSSSQSAFDLHDLNLAEWLWQNNNRYIKKRENSPVGIKTGNFLSFFVIKKREDFCTKWKT